MYRSSADMIREGITLLNEYYYDRMRGNSLSNPITEDKLAPFMRILTCLGGVLGFRPTMVPFISNEKIQLFDRIVAKQLIDIDNRSLSNTQTALRDLDREIDLHRASGLMLSGREKLIQQANQIRSEIFSLERHGTGMLLNRYMLPRDIPKLQSAAIAKGMSIRDVEELIEWEFTPIPEHENKALIEFVLFTMNEESNNLAEFEVYEKLVQSYTFCMAHYPTLYKFGENYDLRDHTVKSYFLKASHRAMWQVTHIRFFLLMCFVIGGSILQKEPVKTASNRYEETLRVERPQHDLVTDMELELSRLPRYQAYVKFIDEAQDRQIVRTHQMHTHPLQEIKDTFNSQGINDKALSIHFTVWFNSLAICKKRDEIEEEIRQRQARWQRGGSAPGTRGNR